uniref:Uncharacterized protein n=1 Tax=Triticum urartu TaxID=4572 RepID=A0A8R7UUJ9_TRIUA
RPAGDGGCLIHGVGRRLRAAGCRSWPPPFEVRRLLHLQHSTQSARGLFVVGFSESGGRLRILAGSGDPEMLR